MVREAGSGPTVDGWFPAVFGGIISASGLKKSLRSGAWSLDIFRPCAVVSDELFPTDISRRGDSRIAHPFKGGIASPIPKVPKGRLSHSRSILCPEQTVRIEADVGHWGIRPSLRDLCDCQFEPSSELLG